MHTATISHKRCYHCGDTCDSTIAFEDKFFCCEGCRQVFLLLNENNLCTYYDLDKNPGIKARGKFLSERFAYLDDEQVKTKLIRYTDGAQSHVSFYLPGMHCASCIWLLENLHRIQPGIISSRTNFQRKEVYIIFNPGETSLRKIVELLAFTGYEPWLSLDDPGNKASHTGRMYIYRIGVTGFCFGNIMMLSFPEYFSAGHFEQQGLKTIFNYLNLLLSLPVLFFGAAEFFISAWKGLRQKWLNIDAPVALAILVTFCRSIYDILSGSGPGYLDSMSGIVFFMLVGRWFQNRTYDAISFDRDYKSYFPLGVTRVDNGMERNIPLSQLQKGDHILVRHEEMIPADAILLNGMAAIDYSFVSGETTPLVKRTGELIYAGGKQTGGAIELEVVTPVSSSYISQLWNNEIFHNKKNKEKSFIHPWSRYFTYALFLVALVSGVYWYFADSSKILPAVTSILIVACPCSLLLSATFTYGNMLRIFGNNKMYLKNAGVIEALGRIDTIVLDKTGTITHQHSSVVQYEGDKLSRLELEMIRTVTRQSSHPLSRIIAASLGNSNTEKLLTVQSFREFTGKGIEAVVNEIPVRVGSESFTRNSMAEQAGDSGTHIHVTFDNLHKGHFSVSNDYRYRLRELAEELSAQPYELHLVSGDLDHEKHRLRKIFGENASLLFQRTPQEKLEYVRAQQAKGRNVLMVGDGLNDAGALQQSNVGVAVSDNTNLFSPASDAILDGSQVHLLGRFLQFARSGKKIVAASFALSILYNAVGLYFATRGLLSPLIAALLMPASSISIVLFVTFLSNASARRNRLS